MPPRAGHQPQDGHGASALTVPSVVKLREEENHGEDLALPVGAMSTRYGSETVVLSPLELITKVPDVVSPV